MTTSSSVTPVPEQGFQPRRPGRPGTRRTLPGAVAALQAMSSDPDWMPATVEVRGPTLYDGPPDPDGQLGTTPGGLVYRGPARLFPVPLNERSVQQSGQPEQLSRWYLRLPVGTPIAERQTVKVVDADRLRVDPSLVGRRFRVTDHTPQTFGTDLRVTVSEEPVP